MSGEFNVKTNTDYLVEILKKSIDECKKSDAGVTTRQAKKDENGDPIQMLQLSPEQLFNILSISLKDIVEMVGSVRSELTETINELKAEISSLRRELINVKCDLEMHQQYGNRDTLKLCNVPEPKLPPKVNEDTNQTVIDVLKKAGINVSKQDISVSHRLPSKDGVKPIICKFGLRNVRNHVIRGKKQMRESNEFKDSYPDVFMVEHLTPLRGKVAYQLRKDDTIAKSWSIDGRLKVLKVGYSDSDKPINITSLQDLTKLDWSQARIDDLIMNRLNR